MAEQRREFLVVNLEQIKVDAARGEGEHLDALASLSGCQGQQSKDEFKFEIQRNFLVLFFGSASSESRPDAIATRIDQAVQLNPSLRKSCRIES